MAQQQFSSYEDFFTFYLHEHSDARNRAMQSKNPLQISKRPLAVPISFTSRFPSA